jgi:hypothetical protein
MQFETQKEANNTGGGFLSTLKSKMKQNKTKKKKKKEKEKKRECCGAHTHTHTQKLKDNAVLTKLSHMKAFVIGQFVEKVLTGFLSLSFKGKTPLYSLTCSKSLLSEC